MLALDLMFITLIAFLEEMKVSLLYIDKDRKVAHKNRRKGGRSFCMFNVLL